MRLGTSQSMTSSNHAVRPESPLTAPTAYCGIKVGLRFSNPQGTDPQRYVSCQKCRKALGWPNIMDVRRASMRTMRQRGR